MVTFQSYFRGISAERIYNDTNELFSSEVPHLRGAFSVLGAAGAVEGSGMAGGREPGVIRGKISEKEGPD